MKHAVLVDGACGGCVAAMAGPPPSQLVVRVAPITSLKAQVRVIVQHADGLPLFVETRYSVWDGSDMYRRSALATSPLHCNPLSSLSRDCIACCLIDGVCFD